MPDPSAAALEDKRRWTRDERRRLEECSIEPIRTPGVIQSHGTLLAVDEQTGAVVAASEDAAHWLGRQLADASDPTVGWAAAQAVAVDPVRVEFDGRRCDMIVHRGTAPLLVELEPVEPDLEYVRTGVVGAIQRIASITDPDLLRVTAAAEIKAVTGFDRVMCYHFHDDGHGEIVADEREPGMEPYGGLHFPASDIPSQARALYLEKRSRAIVDTADAGAAVLTTTGAASDLDLGVTELRAASPHHLQFMRNMDQAATVSLSLVHEQRLIGMITCAHRTPKRLPVLLRRALEVLAAQVATQLTAADQIRALRRELDARERRTAVVAPMYGSQPTPTVLLRRDRTVLDVVPATGVYLRLADRVDILGVVPSVAGVSAIVDALGTDFHTDALPVDHPELAARVPGVAGTLAVPLSDAGDTLVFLRGEAAHEVEWLGDQTAANRDDPLSPRRSFSAWRESVTGRSLPWDEHLRDAADLAADIRAAMDRRREAELAELALHDALTGLYNRRYLDERLSALDDIAAARTAMVFVDLDDFKQINDTYGHETGDIVLSAVGRRLASHARSGDAVVRLGGDEFVIVLFDADGRDARRVGDRMLATLAEPIVVDELVLRITASAGVVAAGHDLHPSDLLSNADAAMYRAKRAGGARLSA